MSPAPSPHRLRRLGAVLSVGLLLATACGGGDDDARDTDADRGTDRTEQSTKPPSDDQAADRREVSPPEFALPEEPVAPAGHQVLPARCDVEDGRGTAFAVAVPESWELKGVGSAGSGGALDSSYTLELTTSDGSVKIEITPDRYDLDGTLLDSEGEPWKRHDYDWSSYGSDGEKSGTVTFELVDTIDVAEQRVELFVADRDQDPDFLSTTEHRARVELARLPNHALEGQLVPSSSVISVIHDPDAVTLTSDDVAGIVGSFAIPACTRDRVVTQLEAVLGVDLDDDGRVATFEDLIDRG